MPPSSPLSSFLGPIRYFLGGVVIWHALVDYVGYPTLTEGPSMLPTMHVRGEAIWVSTRYRRGRGIAVGDVIALRHPWDPEVIASKRVLGMPGDFVLRGGLHTEGGSNDDDEEARTQRKMIQVPQGHCWVEGDNPPWSRDSRDYGPVPLALIKGKTTATIWPLSRVRPMKNTLRPAAAQASAPPDSPG